MNNPTAPISFHAEQTLADHTALLDRAIRDSFSGTRSYEVLSAAHRPSLARTLIQVIDAWRRRRDVDRAAARLAATAATAEIRDIQAWAARAALSTGFGGDGIAANDDAFVTAA